MNNSIEIITTGDGSQSLFNAQLNETYHSTHGAVQESKHVFIHKGLEPVLAQNEGRIFILEIGFGTGLNALLTLEIADSQKRNIQFTSIDNFPLPKEIWSKLSYTSLPATHSHFQRLHEVSWDETHAITSCFELHKVKRDLKEASFEKEAFHLIYFDAFAPGKQPELWERVILEKMYHALQSQGIFVTYCAKGQVKRDLKAIGFEVQTLEGPPGKKEMIRAMKP